MVLLIIYRNKKTPIQLWGKVNVLNVLCVDLGQLFDKI